MHRVNARAPMDVHIIKLLSSDLIASGNSDLAAGLEEVQIQLPAQRRRFEVLIQCLEEIQI